MATDTYIKYSPSHEGSGKVEELQKSDLLTLSRYHSRFPPSAACPTCDSPMCTCMHSHSPTSAVAFSDRLKRSRLLLVITISWWVMGVLAVLLATHMHLCKLTSMQLHGSGCKRQPETNFACCRLLSSEFEFSMANCKSPLMIHDHCRRL